MARSFRGCEKIKVLLTFAAITATIVMFIRLRHVDSRPTRQQPKQLLIPTSVRIVDPSEADYIYNNENDTRCIHGKVADMMVPICTYSPTDNPIVSAFIQRGQYWEPEYVAKIVQLLRTSTSENDTSTVVSFVDIGANVGAYSLAAAHSGSDVSI